MTGHTAERPGVEKICVPVRNHASTIIGVTQAMNKEGQFSDKRTKSYSRPSPH